MKSTTAFSLSLLAASALAAPIPLVTPAPRLPAKRQIGVSVIGSTTIAGNDAIAFASAASGAAVAAVGSSSAQDSSASSSADSGSGSGSSESSSSSSDSGSSSSSSEDSNASSTSSASKSKSTDSGSNSSSSGKSSSQDQTVLQFALVLEQLETEFYKQGLATFDKNTVTKAGLSSTQADILIQTFQEQANDEKTHVDFLTSALNSLGAKPANKCQFDFKSVLTNPATFISAARTIELVGVSAYAGGANLIQDPAILTDAASILSIEARHQSALNVFSGGTFAAQAFDIALTPNSVLSLVSGFLQGCQASDLGLSANQPLSVINSKTGNTLITGNTILAFESPVLNAQSDANNLFCQLQIGGQAEASVQPISNCQIPNDVNGPVMAFVTNSKTPLSADVTKQDEKSIVAGPAALFVDQGTETFQKLFDIKGFGISQIAAVNTGSIAIGKDKNNNGNNNGNNSGKNSKSSSSNSKSKSSSSSSNSNSNNDVIIDIIEQSNPNATYNGPLTNGMIYDTSASSSKRGFEDVVVLGWK